MQRSTLVLGLGNPLRGDDGVGPRVVEELKAHKLPKEVDVLDVGNAGLDLLPMLEGVRRAVIVDAADVGRDPGQFVRFTPQEVQLAPNPTSSGPGRGFSFHNGDLAEVLALADALGQALPEIVIFGVQPAKIDWQEGLSPILEETLPTLIDAILEEIRR